MTASVAGLIARMTLLTCTLTVLAGPGCASAAAVAGAGPAEHRRAADASASSVSAVAGTGTAPSGPPLTLGGAGAGGAGGAGGTGQGAEASPQGETDPLVGNGLGSPLCKGALGGGELSASGRRHCETSGFVAAAAPTGDYGIDVHIDTGVLGLSSGGLLSVVQDLFVTPLWMALVWAVHCVVVMLEWCFTIDLLDSAAAGGVGRGLRQMYAAFTEPWLAIVLAVASVLALYDGLVRRRVAVTVGQALLMATMMVGGMWVIADPTGTVGALGGWSNQASLGTLAVAARGAPADSGGVLADSMQTVFAAVVEAPWCYLEFGDVGWCRDPARLDPRLRGAGVSTAARELTLIGCRSASSAILPCAAPGSADAEALKHSAELLGDARSNGAIFLALPANGPARNSIGEEGSLLRAICESPEFTSCRGPTAAQAEFRGSAGTWSRVGGLLLIVAGALGMILLLGFIALRLLAAAIFSLLYLLLAPVVVLAPALGEGGRAVFRRWATQLLGAVVSKLMFSFLLGVVLAVLAILSHLESLGWWTQWLLMSAFWWGAYARRHQAVGVASEALGRGSSGPSRAPGPRSLGRRVSDVLESRRRASGSGRSLPGGSTGTAPPVDPPPESSGSTPALDWGFTGERTGGPASGSPERARHEAPAPTQAPAGETLERPSERREQLERVRAERVAAAARGDTRRTIELEHRERRIEQEIERERESSGMAGAGDLEDASPKRGVEGVSAGAGRRAGERLADAQAARLQVDRELALRRELNTPVDRPAESAAAPESDGRERPADRGPSAASESSVMRDAREVAAGRKRQLGRDWD